MDVSSDPRWDRLPHLFAGELPEGEARTPAVAAIQRRMGGEPGRVIA